MEDAEQTVARLEGSYGRWRVWQADTGEWWASVRKNLTMAQEHAGRVPYLRAEWAPGLEQLMAEEDARTWLHDRGYPFVDAISLDRARSIYERASKDPDGDVRGNLVDGFSYVVSRQGKTVLLRAKVRPAPDA